MASQNGRKRKKWNLWEEGSDNGMKVEREGKKLEL